MDTSKNSTNALSAALAEFTKAANALAVEINKANS